MTGPTLPSTAVVRGEVPTEAPLILGQNDPTAAAAVSGGYLPPLAVGTPEAVKQPIQITGAGGRPLSGELYSGGGPRVPGVLMLAPDSAGWLDLPLRLQAAGFTVLTMALSAVSTVEDMRAALESLAEDASVDPGTLVVVGAEDGADLALISCAVEPLCDAVALVSPTQRDALLVAMQRYNPRPIFLAAGTDDAATMDAARALADYAQGEAVLETGQGAARGAGLIQANPPIGDRLIAWLRR